MDEKKGGKGLVGGGNEGREEALWGSSQSGWEKDSRPCFRATEVGGVLWSPAFRREELGLKRVTCQSAQTLASTCSVWC